jgi:hypothetical protein
MELQCFVTFSDSEMVFQFTGKCENIEAFKEQVGQAAKNCVNDPRHYVLHYFDPGYKRFLLLSAFAQLSPDTNELKYIRRVDNPAVCTQTSGGIPKVPLKDNSDAWTEISSLPSTSPGVWNEVTKLFNSTCPITHFKLPPPKPKPKKGAPKAETESKPDVRLVHIIPKYNYRNLTLLTKVLHWGCADVNQVKNLLLLHKTIAIAFDNLLWTFLPLGPVAVKVEELHFYQYKLKLFIHDAVRVDDTDFFVETPTVFLPTQISRNALYLHAYHAHKRWGALEALPPNKMYTACHLHCVQVKFSAGISCRSSVLMTAS